MAKFTSLILLLIVAISWSEANFIKRAIEKRSTEQEITEDTLKLAVVKGFFSEIILLGAKPDERSELEKKFEEAALVNLNESVEDYAKRIVEIFEKVTGREFSIDEATLAKNGLSDVSLEKADSPFARVLGQG